MKHVEEIISILRDELEIESINNPLDIETNEAIFVESKRTRKRFIYVYKEITDNFLLYVYYVDKGELYLVDRDDTLDLSNTIKTEDLMLAPIEDQVDYFNKKLCQKTLVEKLSTFTPKPTKFYPFGIAPLDEKLGGIYFGSLTMVAGRSNTGKTFYSLKFMQSFIKQNLNVDYINLEMKDEDMLEDFFHAKLIIPPDNTSTLVSQRSASLEWITDYICRRNKEGVKIFIVDWLDRLIPRNLAMNPAMISMHQANIADVLSNLSYELNISIILLNQLNKSTVPVSGVIDWYNAAAGSSQVYNVCDTFIGLFDRKSLKPELRDNPLFDYVIEMHVDKVRKKQQKKGMVVIKSTGKMVRALNFEESYAYNEQFFKKGFAKKATTSPKDETEADKRFRELEEHNKQWAKKLGNYTGEAENSKF